MGKYVGDDGEREGTGGGDRLEQEEEEEEVKRIHKNREYRTRE